MEQTFVIHSEGSLAKARHMLDKLGPSDGHHEFSIKPYKRNRSLEQNRLYRKWLKIICDEIGEYDTQAQHQVFKERFLIPILQRECEDWQIEEQACKRLRELGQGRAADFWGGRMKKRASTTQLNVRQFSEFLQCVEIFATELEISLPQPEQIK